MGLGISKAKPKYTPPKVCKKATTVLLPTWNFVACPDTDWLLITIVWPAEPFGLNKETRSVYRLPRNNGIPCVWEHTELHVDVFNASARVEFSPPLPELAVEFEYTGFAGHIMGYQRFFDDYDSRKPKLLLPSVIPPRLGSSASNFATSLITI